MSGRLSEYRILGQWERTVGGLIASHARPIGVRGSKLVLAVDSPAWMQQLSLLKPEIIEKVNRGLGKKDAIKEVALKLGEVTAIQRFSPPRPMPYQLTAEEQGKIEGFVADVRDPDVRESLRRLIEKDFLRKKDKRA
jgi:hypothetical protein